MNFRAGFEGKGAVAVNLISYSHSAPSCNFSVRRSSIGSLNLAISRAATF